MPEDRFRNVRCESCHPGSFFSTKFRRGPQLSLRQPYFPFGTSTLGMPKSPPNSERELMSSVPTMLTTVSSVGSAARIGGLAFSQMMTLYLNPPSAGLLTYYLTF